MQNSNPPAELLELKGGEPEDFMVRASRANAPWLAAKFLTFGTMWSLFDLAFFAILFGPILLGKEINFELNGVPTSAGPGNLEPLILPAIIVGAFLLIGLGMIAYGIWKMKEKGGWFLGTPTRLINVNKLGSHSIDWEQFSGDILVRQNTVLMKLRSGEIASSKNSGNQYVPDVVVMAGIPDASHIAELCRKRIKENDPTP